MYFVEVENVVKQYARHLALDHVSMGITRGKIFGLLGPNGAGKTTLIRIINRITAPDSGTIHFDGRLLQPSDIFRIGYLPEERGLYKKMKVGEQALYFARLKGLDGREARKRLTHWFEKFDIMPWWNKRLEELSKGMQQKVQFIITVVHQPDLLIFDEPFSGFDPINTDLLKDEMLALRDAGCTLIFSTHNMVSVEEICDEIALVNRSKVVLAGNIRDVREQFKENIFRVHVTGDYVVPSPHRLYSVLSVRQTDRYTELTIRKNGAGSNSILLQALSEQYEIHLFNEVLPSMHDIFVRAVKGEPEQNACT
ncbi:MAG: ATP-binding cassette domain-containing protein [Tannerella sp.]|jgi:ABC-2 type transport system ATP-binding protein|nr:ATP-binding cassette domain-containing protein [Tannerella sp.]